MILAISIRTRHADIPEFRMSTSSAAFCCCAEFILSILLSSTELFRSQLSLCRSLIHSFTHSLSQFHLSLPQDHSLDYLFVQCFRVNTRADENRGNRREGKTASDLFSAVLRARWQTERKISLFHGNVSPYVCFADEFNTRSLREMYSLPVEILSFRAGSRTRQILQTNKPLPSEGIINTIGNATSIPLAITRGKFLLCL